MRLLLAIFTSLLIAATSLFSQSLSVFNIDTTNFPIIKAKFWAFDASGNQIKNLTETDFEVTENGIARTVTNVSCPPDKPLQTVSVAMSIDVSGSMSYSGIGEIPVELGKITATDLCKAIAMPPSDFALQTCDAKALIIQDFTKDKNKILTSIAPITAYGDNDFVEHLMNKLTGLLNIAKTGKNKKVAVIYTDAWWYALNPQELQQCKDTCARYDIQFYAVIYSRLEAEPNGIKKSLHELADATGGILYDGITSTVAAKEIANRLQSTSQEAGSCEITWLSGVSCTAGRTNATIKLISQNLTDNVSYQIPNTSVAKLELNPAYLRFQNPPIATTVSQDITVTARNSAFTVTDIKTSNTLFSISPKSFTLQANESKILTISYIAKDSGYTYTKFSFEADNHCNKDFYASAGWMGVKPVIPALKVTHPNGGEMFAVGSDTVITWEGIPANNLVRLEYSIDNGTTWKYIDTSRNLSYRWMNVPLPTSNQCIVKASLLEEPNSLAQSIVWSKTYSGTDNNYLGCSIIESSDQAYVLAGSISSIDSSSQGFFNIKDYSILKLNTITGDTIWTQIYGNSSNDYGCSIVETSNHNYVIVGISVRASNGNIQGNNGDTDYWIIELNQFTGDTIWTQTYGGSSADYATSVIESKDGSYIIAGYTLSNDFDVQMAKGKADYWILKVNPNDGGIIWSKTYGGSNNDIANSIIESKDGSYIVAGYTASKDYDVHQNKGSNDYWILKLNPSNGDIIWSKTYGGSNEEIANSIIEDSDGNYIVAGYTESKNGDIKENKGDKDYWVLKLNPSNGDIIWSKTYGGSDGDYAYSVIQGRDGGYVVAGNTDSKDADIFENTKQDKCWILKFTDSESIQTDQSDSLFSIVAPEIHATAIDMKECLVNSIKDSLVTNFIQNTGTYKCRIDSIYFAGDDPSAFSLVSGIPKYEVAAGANKATEFRFKPTEERVYNAEIVIISQADTQIVTITGIGVAQKIEVLNNLIDFGVVKCGESKQYTDTATIRNVGKDAITITKITNAGPNNTDFEILNLAPTYKLQVGDSLKLSLKFTATSIGRTSGRLLIDYEGQLHPAEVQLYAQAVGGLVRIDDDSAFAGEKKKIRLRLMNNINSNQGAAILPFRAKIKYNPTLLTMTDSRGKKSVDKEYEICDVKGNWNMTNGNLLGEFDYIAGLGNAISSYLLLDEFFWLDENGKDINAEVEKIDGKFTLLGICHEGGTRLVNPNANIGIQSITPNPAKDKITITAKITEIGTKIKLIDIAGKVIKEIDCIVDKAKVQEFTIDLTNIPAGMYFIEFKSPNFSQVEKVVVEK